MEKPQEHHNKPYLHESDMRIQKEPAEGLVTYYPSSIRKIGLYFIIIPLPAMIVMIIMFAIIDSAAVSSRALEFIATALGFLAVVGFIASVPISITMSCIKRYAPTDLFDPRSGQGNQSIVPDEIKKWSWGAAGLSIIWGFYHRVWWSAMNFAPYANLVWWIIMGLKGNQWAWQANKWQSIEEFKAKQKPWNIVGIIFFILGILVFIASIIFPVIALMQMSASTNF